MALREPFLERRREDQQLVRAVGTLLFVRIGRDSTLAY
jgi:hypothetical protein